MWNQIVSNTKEAITAAGIFYFFKLENVQQSLA